jgi:subtilisin family serine protease
MCRGHATSITSPPYPFGNSGVDIFAPGGDFLDDNILDLDFGPCSEDQLTLPFTCTFSDYVFAAGTSESAPHVSGARRRWNPSSVAGSPR